MESMRAYYTMSLDVLIVQGLKVSACFPDETVRNSLCVYNDNNVTFLSVLDFDKGFFTLFRRTTFFSQGNPKSVAKDYSPSSSIAQQ